ncbi:helix-turn-helix transcriptional regulator, partial [Candidatus Dojkabacteria bacterium]|nr:helix-turn-helix transcriptional regulator [Candidatus Dojkabacteria bacterium]
SQKSGIPRPTISKIESGKRNVTIDTLTALAAAMGKRIELNFV